MNSVEITFYADPACTKPDPAGLYFRGGKSTEQGTGIVKAAYVRWGARWGNATIRIVASDAAAKPFGEAPAGQDWWALPPAARYVTVEGRREHAGVVVTADLLQLAT